MKVLATYISKWYKCVIFEGNIVEVREGLVSVEPLLIGNVSEEEIRFLHAAKDSSAMSYARNLILDAYEQRLETVSVNDQVFDLSVMYDWLCRVRVARRVKVQKKVDAAVKEALNGEPRMQLKWRKTEQGFISICGRAEIKRSIEQESVYHGKRRTYKSITMYAPYVDGVYLGIHEYLLRDAKDACERRLNAR